MSELIDKTEKKKNIKKEIIEWAVCFVIAYIIYLIINYFLGTVSGVKQVSMYPTAKDGEKIIISRRVIFRKPLERGQIIIFKAPYYDKDIINNTNIANYKKLTGTSKFLHDVIGVGKISYIKRIIGLPGDKIFISENGELYVNDILQEEKYLDSAEKTYRLTDKYYDLIVPKDCVYVVGDNRDKSSDSRFFGTIPISKIEGNVVLRIWPLNRFGKLDK